MTEQPAGRKCLSRRHLVARYGRGGRTIRRWIKDGILPPPDFTISGYEYWYEETIEAADRNRSVDTGERVQTANLPHRERLDAPNIEAKEPFPEDINRASGPPVPRVGPARETMR